MRLSQFILSEREQILVRWEAFARTQMPAAESMGALALRDHAEQILQAIAKDLETYQSRQAQTQKSLGLAPVVQGAPETAAQTHALLRAQSGFDIRQLAAEYRALRASVLRLWTDAQPKAADMFEQVMRFNEAIDEALVESIGHFHMQVERNRNLLLGMLGHDLRSPLQSIQTTAAYLTALDAGTAVSEAATRLINSGSRMKALLDDLVDFNRTKLGVGIVVRPAEIESAAVLTDELNLLRAAVLQPGRQRPQVRRPRYGRANPR
jgi:signal transduction histidine kinase